MSGEFHDDLWQQAEEHVALNKPSPIDAFSPSTLERWVEEKYQDLVDERNIERQAEAADRAKSRRKYGH